MALLSLQQLPTLLETLPRSQIGAVLFFGEPYLCRNAAGQIEEALLADGGIVHPIDGDEENVHDTFARISSFSLLGGRQIYRVSNTTLLYSKHTGKALWERVVKARINGQDEQTGRALTAFVRSAGLSVHKDVLKSMSAAQWKKCFAFALPDEELAWTATYLRDTDRGKRAVPTAANPGDVLIELLEKGLPPANMLLLLASEVDKRKKLFKYLKEHEIIIDCSVATGSGAKARGEQEAVLRSLAAATLKEQGKTLAPELMPILLDRVGFHPVALVNELRKLMLAAGENTAISRDDLDELLGRTRQDALYELNGSIAEGNLAEALVQLQRLLNNGIHPLAIMASLRNFVRNALLFRALMDGCSTPFHPTMSFNSFQQQYLPQLQAGETWKKEFSAHPYALYNQFKDAARGSLAQYSTWMELLLAAEFRLKGSPANAELVLHRLLCSMFDPVPHRTSVIPLPPLAKSPARITIIP